MKTKIVNWFLCKRYPFLKPRNRWTGKVVDDYDYSFTELDDMPTGWRKAFGLKMCEEIRKQLTKEGNLYTYEIMQIKEKFGSLRWYDNYSTRAIQNIIDKYEEISKVTCINCGKPAKWISTGWISPWCDKCAKNIYNNRISKFYGGTTFKDEYVPIEKYWE